MNYKETIEYLYKQLPMFSRIGPAAYKKDLHNTITLCSSLDNPETKFKTIHIAGTNGKGSTSHMIAAILQEAGFKTGLYTSPHIKDFKERIRINGRMIDEDFVIDFTERTRKLSEEIKPSFFELTVAMAFDYFAINQVDIAVIETGLGGRLDSTNVIKPVLSVITNIGFDHVNILGESLPEIASEKAGIIKFKTPVVIGETLPETLPVFIAKANEQHADLYFASDRYSVNHIKNNGAFLTCDITDNNNQKTEQYELDLAGSYQSRNLCTVLTVIDTLNSQKFNIIKPAIHKALQNVKKTTGLTGRWEVARHNPEVILDVAHNQDGIKQVLQQLNNNYAGSDFHFVLGFVNDKDISGILALFPQNARYYFTNAHIPRALPYKKLQELAAERSLSGNGFDNVNDAIESAIAQSNKKDVIMVCGSFFIIAEVEG